jgi:glycosyltransferase involved in cell wall biosynthesis
VKARKRLGLPLDKKVILNYGIGVYRHLHLLPKIERLNEKYPLIFLVITGHPDWFDLWDAVRGRYKFVKLIRASLPNEELYSYLHASDALLVHKDSSEAVVVASTVYLCLGSGCPILTHATNFVETLDKEVVKYSGDPTERLIEVFEEKEAYWLTREKALQYVEDYSGHKTAIRFKELLS